MLRLNWNKRYITLASISTVLGLAFQLRDPQNLLGKGQNPGITCALVPTDAAGVDVGQRHDPLPHRTNRVKPLGSGPLPIRPLEVSSRYVIHTRQAGDGVERRCLVGPTKGLAHDDPDLTFVLHLLRRAGELNRIPVANEGRRRLEEQQRLHRDPVTQLLGVRRVVSANADDFGRAPSKHQ